MIDNNTVGKAGNVDVRAAMNPDRNCVSIFWTFKTALPSINFTSPTVPPCSFVILKSLIS